MWATPARMTVLTVLVVVGVGVLFVHGLQLLWTVLAGGAAAVEALVVSVDHRHRHHRGP